MNKLILTNINELVTCRGKAPKCGSDMSNVGVIHDACVVIEGERISAVGSSKDVLSQYSINEYKEINCSGKAVLPGFIDSHTHFIFGGFRNKEFSMRLEGSSYMDIQNSGGGIASTVKSTRNASIDALIETGLKRADSMLSFGVTTVEGKSGYGLDSDTELKQLEAMKQINESHPIDVVSTFMGAHSVPVDYKGREIEYLEFLVSQVLPTVKKEKLAEFVDIFCEQGVFNIEQSEFYLTKAKEIGFELKLHADEIVQTGGAELSAKLNAISADHLLSSSKKGIKDMAKRGVISTLLPATAFTLKEKFANARNMIESGCAVALATDFNPGSSFTNSIPLVIALAALNMEMNIREIVVALTINGACAINRQSDIGSIEKGKRADIIVLDYPTIDFLSYHTGINIVKTVIKNGKVVIDI